MQGWVDESGDAGTKFDRGSSSWFFLALVQMPGEAATIAATERIEELRHRLKLGPRFEFHFNETRRDMRIDFLRMCRHLSFSYYVVALDKRRLHGSEFRRPAYLYERAWRILIDDAAPSLDRVSITVDQYGGRSFQAGLRRTLLAYANRDAERIGQIAPRDSARFELLQLADMVVGAVARSYSNRPDAMLYRDIIRPREESVHQWPE